MRITTWVGVAVAVLMLGNARTALAGPPLLCQPYDIGKAQSLPWQGHEWWPGRGDYNTANLVSDTMAILTPSTPVLVRMETMRRATIYATGDRAVAERLLAAVLGRARELEAAGRPDPLAWLDAAYLAEALREVGDLANMSNNSPFIAAVRAVDGLTAGLDGYVFILKSLDLRPGDPSIEFAAALIATRETGRDGSSRKYVEHAAKARAGATRDALLTRNLDHIQ
jgi:hypothetical protein